MTEYTPEKVALLLWRARDTTGYKSAHDLIDDLVDALAAVSADRDRLHKAITEALEHDPMHGRSCLHVTLRAALDKEGSDDE